MTVVSRSFVAFIRHILTVVPENNCLERGRSEVGDRCLRGSILVRSPVPTDGSMSLEGRSSSIKTLILLRCLYIFQLILLSIPKPSFKSLNSGLGSHLRAGVLNLQRLTFRKELCPNFWAAKVSLTPPMSCIWNSPIWVKFRKYVFVP